MPIAADPNATTDFALKVDRDKPEETRPVFKIRFMSQGEHDKIDELVQQAFELPPTKDGNKKCFQLLCAAAGVGLVGWRNMKDENGNEVIFDQTKIEDGITRIRLTSREMWELVRNYPLAVRLASADFFE